ncbi:MAG: beta-ketoacyl synthase N-terminal-like domain-containing protein [Christiangramia sp.]|uniref:beta-ketoacyl synthase N-terminal-like domain-containing protein n=1 Tax=Christiangramia sp. TaxID=1931228 RepID=UPI003241F752
MSSYLVYDSIMSPLGFGTSANLQKLRRGESGLQKHIQDRFFPEGFFAGIINSQECEVHFSKLKDPQKYTRLEKLMMLAISDVLEQAELRNRGETGLVIATTKGNIDLLEKNDFDQSRLKLWKLASVIAEYFGFQKPPVVVSNACISGALALKVGDYLLKSGTFKNVIVASGDLVSDFVLSGFQSFQVISPQPCRPFSADRQGVSLGEGTSAVLLSSEKKENSVELLGAVTANDANHISGPSRDGEGLHRAIEKLLKITGIDRQEIDYISAHGTATAYNDEMEAIAFGRSELQRVPVNSFKAYYGHSLGNSALVESILTRHSLVHSELYESLNFSEKGTSVELNVIRNYQQADLKLALKTASGFGGCNLALMLKKS